MPIYILPSIVQEIASVKGAEATRVEISTEMKKCFRLNDMLSFNINMFWQHYLGNKKPTFLACNPEHVYAAILEFSKHNVFFRTAKLTLADFL